jgi:CO/xanthine dehydrogenase FAD-binding subunit
MRGPRWKDRGQPAADRRDAVASGRIAVGGAAERPRLAAHVRDVLVGDQFGRQVLHQWLSFLVDLMST